MEMLIVDDEYYSVEWIRDTIESSGIPLTLHCAYSMEEAQEIFLAHPVSILLSDIEMPRGTGLELLEWVRDKGFSTICVFLTSFATFDYANCALKLQTSDYLLKPISKEDLITAVRKAIAKYQSNRQKDLHAEYWADSQTQNTEAFWARITLGKISPDAKSIEREIRRRHLPENTAAKQWLPILLRCQGTEQHGDWDKRLYEYGVKNILAEIFYLPEEDPVIPIPEENHFLILQYIRAGQTTEDRENDLRRAFCSCVDTLPGIFHFFPAGFPCGAEELSAVYHELLALANNVIYGDSMIFFGKENHAETLDIPQVPWSSWHELLLSKKSSRVLQESRQYLSELKRCPHASRQDLVVFQHDFLQMVYNLLDKLGGKAHDLVYDNETVALSQEACDSTDAMKVWTENVLSAFEERLRELTNLSDEVELVKQYISQHLSEDLTRNSLAELVYLSPDYLSHLFTKKEGMSLTDYINVKRINFSKELLLSGKYRIGDIALKSGFQNISYFSRQFKRHTGQTPYEFKKSNLK